MNNDPAMAHMVVITVESARFIGWVIFLSMLGLALIALDPMNPKKKDRGPWKKK
jgi:hypothetical protein